MYSKSNTPRSPYAPSSGPRPIGDRPPVPHAGPSYRQRVRVPLNYSGNAIVDGEERTPGDVPLPDGIAGDVPAGGEEALRYVADRRPGEPLDEPRPYFDGLPRVGEMGNQRVFYPSEDPAVPNGSEVSVPDVAASSVSAVASTFSSARRPLLDGTHFPFGHGIGSEELLLLGLMYFLFREGGISGERGDLDETLLLLGILLLCG